MFEHETQLDDALSEPSERVIDHLSRIDGDVLVLGAGGKMGYTLTRMVKRADDAGGSARRVTAVSRFGRPGQQQPFHAHGIETLAGDLMDREFLSQLPDTPNLIFMTGVKFGTGDDAARTWAMNVLMPADVCRRFSASRIMAFSTGNVYPLVPVTSPGCLETDAPAPVGEYAMTALGRERMFEYFSNTQRTPVSVVRLNYAVEMRYGVLVDLAVQVAREQVIDLTMGHVNVIWQGDANAWALCALADASCPRYVINVAGPEVLPVRVVCERFGQLLGKDVRFSGTPAPTALLNNGQRALAQYGPLRMDADQLITEIAAWLQRGGTTWDKPTHFQTRDGKF